MSQTKNKPKAPAPAKVAYKYALKSVYLRMPRAEATLFLAAFVRLTGKSKRTFYNYCEIPLGSTKSVPSDILDQLAILMSVPVADLKNYKVKPFPTSPAKEALPHTGLKFPTINK